MRLVLLGLLGCTQTTLPPVDTGGLPDSGLDSAVDTADSGGDSGPDTVPDDSAADTDEDHEDTATVDEIGDMGDDLDSWIFSDETIHQIDITLDADDIAGLYADPYTSVEGAFSFDGIALDSVGVRLRGKIGSFRDLGGKPKFAIDFNAFTPDQRFYGLESLSLNNSVVDCSYLKEPLGYRIFELAGVPHQRTGFAWVRVNGADYGLYVLIETPDDRMLKRVYPDPSGNLYDGKYVWYGGYNYILLDFAIGVDDYFQLEEGVDVKNADIKAVSAAVAAAPRQGFQRTTGTVLNWEEYHRELAVEQWIGHNDGYALNTNNYRVYFDPTDGKAQIIPWDLDYAFLNAADWGMSWASPRGKLAAGCFADDDCVAAHKKAVAALIAAVDPAELVPWYNSVAALTEKAAMADPRKECGNGSVSSWRTSLREYVQNENAALASYWGL